MTAPARRRPAALLAVLLMASCAGSDPPEVAPDDVARRAWTPDEPPQAVILALHGFNDYSAAFEGFASHAAEHGIAVHAYDQRGFGTNPDAGHWPGTGVLIADLGRARAKLRASYPDAPLYLLGESMGAAVIMAAAAEAPLEADGVILVAPAVWGGDQLNPLYRATLWLASKIAPGWTFTGERVDVLPSDNLDMLRAMARDPNVIKATRVDAIAGLVELMDRAVEGADALAGPLLVLIGARDEIVPPEAQVALLQRLDAEPCREVVYPEGYHMLLRDLQREVVWADILAWIDGEALPSGLAEPCGDSASPVAASLG